MLLPRFSGMIPFPVSLSVLIINYWLTHHFADQIGAQASLLQRQEYETWLGIKHFWGPGGLLQLGHYPPSVVQGSAEDAARRLKQSHISSCKTAIDQHISKIPVILPPMEVSRGIHNPELF
jgi:hypothetical protein